MIEAIRRNGIVGAGGAGFPTYAKIKPPIDILAINGAECEPLLHKDKELLKKFGDRIVEGVARLRDFIGAKEAVLGIKEKYHEIIDTLQGILPQGVRIAPLGDYYPAGDEFVLVYEVTGRVIPRGGLPIHVGVLVMNVETVLNIVDDQPITSKYLTVGGAVHHPSTFRFPIGISVREAVEACGGATVEPYRVLSGGVMMGRLVGDLNQPITKTTGGLLVFPVDHPLIRRYALDRKSIKRIGKSACDQCSFCTELCPRYLLGHPIEPHKAMRSLVFSHDRNQFILGSQFCCECNLCSLIACPEDLDPKNVCVINKQEMREQKLSYPIEIKDRPVHGMREGRRVPLARLYKKLGLTKFTNQGPLLELQYEPQRVVIPLRQHIGVPASPTVKSGDRVRVGEIIADVAEKDLGVPIHASIGGTIGQIDDTNIEILRV